MAKSIHRGRDEIVSAVLSADRLLVDFLSDAELAEVRDMWARVRHPDQVALLAQRESDLAHID